VQPSKEKGMESIKKADQWMNEAEKNITVDAYDSCISSAYMAMFHAARAVLFRDGIREKSHYCIARYLEKYVDEDSLEDEWVVLLDRIRDVRHIDQYTLYHHTTEEEADSALKSAKQFLLRIKKFFKDTDPQL
jgi:uncharacterized protein (UPF0332 family)